MTNAEAMARVADEPLYPKAKVVKAECYRVQQVSVVEECMLALGELTLYTN